MSSIATAINAITSETGVSATVSGGGLKLDSNTYGSDAFVSVKAVAGTFSPSAT